MGALSMEQIIQFGALGILGAIVISGFLLFKWAVQKGLPEFLKTLKGCSDKICGSLESLQEYSHSMNSALGAHDKKTDRFDKAAIGVESILSKIDNVAMIQNDHTTAIERLCTTQENLIKLIAVPQTTIERQTRVFENLLEHLKASNVNK